MRTIILFFVAGVIANSVFAKNNGERLTYTVKNVVGEEDSLRHPKLDDSFLILTTIPVESGDETPIDRISKNIAFADSSGRFYVYYMAMTPKAGITFLHLADTIKLSKNKCQEFVVPRDFLQKIKPIDMDKELPVMTKAAAVKFVKNLAGKRVWIIDRREMTNSTLTLTETFVVYLDKYYWYIIGDTL